MNLLRQSYDIHGRLKPLNAMSSPVANAMPQPTAPTNAMSGYTDVPSSPYTQLGESGSNSGYGSSQGYGGSTGIGSMYDTTMGVNAGVYSPQHFAQIYNSNAWKGDTGDGESLWDSFKGGLNSIGEWGRKNPKSFSMIASLLGGPVAGLAASLYSKFGSGESQVGDLNLGIPGYGIQGAQGNAMLGGGSSYFPMTLEHLGDFGRPIVSITDLGGPSR